MGITLECTYVGSSMEYYFPRRIYFNHTLAIIAATPLLPEGVGLRRLDRLCLFTRSLNALDCYVGTALIGRTTLPVCAAQRSSVAFAPLRVYIVWHPPALLYARMCSVQSVRRWRNMKGSCLSGPAMRSS